MDVAPSVDLNTFLTNCGFFGISRPQQDSSCTSPSCKADAILPSLLKMPVELPLGGADSTLDNNENVIARSFRDIRVTPTFAELTSLHRNKLRPNLTKGAFSDVNTYLDIHFRLYREDFLRALKGSIQDFLKNFKSGRSHLQDTSQLWIYKNVRLDCLTSKKTGSPKKAQFVILDPRDCEAVDWKKSDRLITHSLVILFRNDFNEAYVATVNRVYNDEEKMKRGILPLMFVDEPPVTNGIKEFAMLESRNYFGAYKHTLQILQDLDPEELPFKSFIVDVEPTLRPPPYLTKAKSTQIAVIGGQFVDLLNPVTWPSHVDLELNPNQYEALKACLTQELAIIQGPPGTGKTFLALKFIEICIRNPGIWNPGKRKAPILIVCYTNYALDQFLEGVLRIFKRLGMFPSLVRLGNNGDSKEIEPYKLYNLVEVTGKTGIEILKRAFVVGMTTTGAAISNRNLQILKPRIVIAEEAAEVVECHLIPCLLPACEHLILIGDHKQLQPCISVSELANKYHLDISLFERLVNNKLNLRTLTVQHRMRPEIADLLVPSIYPVLDPAPCVRDYTSVLGMTSDLFCISHSHKQSEIPGSTSLSNKYEAKYLTALCKYLVQQNLKPSQITVIAMYNGQVNLLQQSLKGEELCREVEVMTVDGFQGKENDIILLSIVRSNDEANIGFLKKDNRICVAMSRAKIGLYMIGNIEILRQKSSTWDTIYRKLKKAGRVGKVLQVQCQRHGKNRHILEPLDFRRLAPDGGCNQPCGMTLNCGHMCRLRCHPSDLDHGEYLCNFPCQRVCPNGHSCVKSLCYEKCPPCQSLVTVKLPCGHQAKLRCQETLNTKTLLKCVSQCQEPCAFYFDPAKGGCGHLCKGSCSSCSQGLFHMKCKDICNRMRQCGHRCEDECWKVCGACKICKVKVRIDPVQASPNVPERFEMDKIMEDRVSKYFPFVLFYLQQQQKFVNGKIEELQIQKSLWYLNSFVVKATETLDENATIPTNMQADLIDRYYQLFHKFMHRGLPWSSIEIEDFRCEFQRVEHRAIIFRLLHQDGGTPRAVLDKLNALTNVPSRYDENCCSRFEELLWEYAAKKEDPLVLLANLKLTSS